MSERVSVRACVCVCVCGGGGRCSCARVCVTPYNPLQYSIANCTQPHIPAPAFCRALRRCDKKHSRETSSPHNLFHFVFLISTSYIVIFHRNTAAAGFQTLNKTCTISATSNSRDATPELTREATLVSPVAQGVPVDGICGEWGTGSMP